MAMNENGVCKYCGEVKKLCKAHIIPECFYPEKDKGPFWQIQADDFLKRRPIGSYDADILCSNCDNTFSESESYARSIFNDAYLQKYETSDKKGYVLEQGDFDYAKIRRFVLSMLWKAGISKRPECACVGLGEYEQIILGILKGERPDDFNLFKTFVFKFKEKEMDGLAMIKKSRIGGNLNYCFICSGFMFYVMPTFGFKANNNLFKEFWLSPNSLRINKVDKNFNETLSLVHDKMLKQINFMNTRKGKAKNDNK